MQARFYVPWAGRFASPDPALDQHFEQTQRWNIYSYVRNNPVMMTDPTGMIGEANVITAGASATASQQKEDPEERSRRLQKKISETLNKMSNKSSMFKNMVKGLGNAAPRVVLETDSSIDKLGGARLTPDGTIMLSSMLVGAGRTAEGRSLDMAIAHEFRHAAQNQESKSGQVKLITPINGTAKRMLYTTGQFQSFKLNAIKDGDDYKDYLKNGGSDPDIIEKNITNMLVIL